MNKLQGKIFLIRPFEELKYKKLIIYSDTPENARTVANQKYHSHNKQSNELNFSDEKFVYLDKNFSLCEEIHPKIISTDSKSNIVTIEYEGVKYELAKNKPVEHIGGGWI